MASRPGFIVDVQRDSDGGEHPNKYEPTVSVHVRVYWPPLANKHELVYALNEAYAESMQQIESRYGT